MGAGFSGRHDATKPLYQQRHYEDMARTLRELKAQYLVTANMDTLAIWEYAVELFTSRFGRDNPNFKPDKFKQACGYEGVT
jgi:hypothetical protein